MNLYALAWLLWIAGTILIVLSWTGTVSNEAGWGGFVVALIGVGLSFVAHIRPRRAVPPTNSVPLDKAVAPDPEKEG
jgi:hypothetical protein